MKKRLMRTVSQLPARKMLTPIIRAKRAPFLANTSLAGMETKMALTI